MDRLTKAKVLYRIILFILLNITVVAFISNITSEYDTKEVVLRQGSRGEQVRQIQTRLKNWGYYKGTVDGVFGPQTYRAVVEFQRKNGLKVDGIVGPQTLAAIGISSTPAVSSSNNDINILAKIISAEARGEPYNGQVAVGAVIMNRIKHPSFPNTLSGVIYQPGAFTAIVDGQIHAPIVDSAYRAARDALNGVDPTRGAIYYYNPATAVNQWIRSRPILVRIGKHVFCS